MVSFAEFTEFSQVKVSEADFPFLEARAVDVLSALCGKGWNPESAICHKAVEYQIEFILQLGGLDSWTEGSGTAGSRSYSVGGESESISYAQETGSGSGKRVYNGLAISPLAWALLQESGCLRKLRRVLTW